MLELDHILAERIDGRTKGVPGGIAPFHVRDTGKQKWNILEQDLPFPLLVLREQPLEHNLKALQQHCTARGADLAPHGKTTMCPQLFEKQLEHGAWGMTTATISQMQVYRSVGINRIILANQLVGRQAITMVVNDCNAHPDFDFYSLVDSCDLVEYLAGELERAGLTRPLKVLVEMGRQGGRTGCRSLAEAQQVCEALMSRPDLFCLAGFELYEGVMTTASEVEAFVDDAAEWIQTLAGSVASEVSEILVTAGGSAYFDFVVEKLTHLPLSRPCRFVLRSGCYLTHDHGAYEAAQREGLERGHWSSELQPALELWSVVQSRPEKTLALLTMGKRDCPYDAGMPRVQKIYRPGTGWLDIDPSDLEVTHLNDQHGYLKLPKTSPLRVGDVVVCGISHPCTAFDKWKFIPGVDEDYNVVTGYRTFF